MRLNVLTLCLSEMFVMTMKHLFLIIIFAVTQKPADITVCEETDKILSKNSEDIVKTKEHCVHIVDCYVGQIPKLLDFLQRNQNIELAYQYLMHTYFTVLEYCDYCTTNIQVTNRVNVLFFFIHCG